MYHISPQKIPDGQFLAPKPKIRIYRGASLVSCELGKPRGQKGKRHDWRRGQITGFSKQSRRRVLRLVSTLRRTVAPVFVTLTYPDLFPADPRTWKIQLDNLFKRLVRSWPGAVVIWRMEAKPRQTGVNTGKIAPHFHLLVYGVPYLALLTWIPRSWYEVVGSGDPRHFNAGTRVEQVRKVEGVLYYTSKYICKAENYPLPGWGRFWGIVGRKPDKQGTGGLKAIQGDVELEELDEKTAMMVLRYMRRRGSELWHKGRYIGRRKVPGWGTKYTLICNAEFWVNALPKIKNLANG